MTDTGQILSLCTEDENVGGWNLETGMPHVSTFGTAVQVWSICQARPVNVTEAAIAFNVHPLLILEAVEDHPYMLLSGGTGDLLLDATIKHDGE